MGSRGLDSHRGAIARAWTDRADLVAGQPAKHPACTGERVA